MFNESVITATMQLIFDVEIHHVLQTINRSAANECELHWEASIFAVIFIFHGIDDLYFATRAISKE